MGRLGQGFLEAHVQVRGEDWCKPTEGRKMHGAQARSVSGLRILHGEVDEVLREVRFQVLQRQVHAQGPVQEVHRQEVQRIFLQVCWGACSLDDRSLSPWSIFLCDVDARVSLRSARGADINVVCCSVHKRRSKSRHLTSRCVGLYSCVSSLTTGRRGLHDYSVKK